MYNTWRTAILLSIALSWVETTLSNSNIQVINSLEIVEAQQFDKDSVHTSRNHHPQE